MHWDNIGYIGYEIQSLQLLQLFSIKAFILILLVAFCVGCADILQLLPRPLSVESASQVERRLLTSVSHDSYACTI